MLKYGPNTAFGGQDRKTGLDALDENAGKNKAEAPGLYHRGAEDRGNPLLLMTRRGAAVSKLLRSLDSAKVTASLAAASALWRTSLKMRGEVNKG